MKNFDAEIAELEAKIAELQEAKAEYEAQSPAMQLAEVLHDTQCHHNHTDQCGWMYETGVNRWNTGYAHKRYLEKAAQALLLLPGYTTDEIVHIAKTLG